jgi:hypothetical protein
MKRVVLEYMNESQAWVQIADVTLTDGQLEYNLGFSEVMAYGLKATIHSTYQPNDSARITEFNGLYIKDLSDYIVSMNINEVREEYTESMPTGITSANTLDIEFDNSSGYFSLNSEESGIAQYFANDNIITPYFYKDGDDPLTNSLSAGVFYTDKWSESGDGVSISVDARDFSKFMQDDKRKYSRAWQNVNAKVAIKDCMCSLGFNPDNFDIQIPTDRRYPILFIHEQSIWDFFGELGLVERISFGFSRDGEFKVRKTEVDRIVAYDSFFRSDTSEQEIGGMPVESGEEQYVWEQYGPASITNGYLSTRDNATYGGYCAFELPYVNLDAEVALLRKGTQNIRISFRGQWDGASDIIAAKFNFDNNTVNIIADGVTIATFSEDISYSDTSRLRFKVDGVKATVFIDGGKVGSSVEYPTPDRPLGACGILFEVTTPATLATRINSFTVYEQNDPVYIISEDTNLISASTKTEIFNNEVVVKISEINSTNNGRKKLWGAESDASLGYSRMLSGVSATATTIGVEREENQTNGLLDDNGWPRYVGILFIPEFNGDGKCTGGELIKYKDRDNRNFRNCERGYLNTVPKAWPADTYIGEAKEWDIAYETSPALTGVSVYTTAINALEKIPDESPQAHIPIFAPGNFSAKLVIGNIVKYLTPLDGEWQTYRDFLRKEYDIMTTFATSVSGIVPNGKESKEFKRAIEAPDVEDENAIRRYGKNKIEIDSKWVQSEQHAKYLANSFIDEYKTPRLILDSVTIVPPSLELGDRIYLESYRNMNIAEKEYNIIEIGMTYDGGLEITLMLRECKTSGN